jgi:hypothetical protein
MNLSAIAANQVFQTIKNVCGEDSPLLREQITNVKYGDTDSQGFFRILAIDFPACSLEYVSGGWIRSAHGQAYQIFPHAGAMFKAAE